MNNSNDQKGEVFSKDEEPPYDPEKAFPRLRNATWRELEKPGPVRFLSREEIERDYGV